MGKCFHLKSLRKIRQIVQVLLFTEKWTLIDDAYIFFQIISPLIFRINANYFQIIRVIAQNTLLQTQIKSDSMNNDILLIILTLIFVAILIAVNIYILKIYTHSDERGVLSVLYCKIFIILGSTLFQAQALMVPLDVANKSSDITLPGGIDMKSFWYFLFIIVLFCICFLFPFVLFFYEADSQEGICKKMLKSIAYTLVANIASMMLIFISYNFWRYADLPVHAVNADFLVTLDPIDINTIAQTQQDVTVEMETSLAVYFIAIMSFVGWIFVVIFAGVGFFALPIDMINQFRFRPKARKSEDMNKSKNNLAASIKTLIERGDEIKEKDEKQQNDQQSGFWKQWKGRRAVSSQMTEFKARFYSIEEQFQIFNLELKFSDTNPIISILKLILGIIFLITSILWILQILFGNISKFFFHRPLIPFMNELLIGLDNGGAGFLSTGLYFYLCLYLIWCVQKGTVKFGLRLPGCCRFHPMKQGQTWMNSFLFNVILMLISSVGIIQLCISSFPTYTRNADIYTIIGLQLNYMRFYSVFYQNSIFPIALIIMTGLSLIYMLITCNKKPKYMQDIDRIRNHEEKDFAI